MLFRLKLGLGLKKERGASVKPVPVQQQHKKLGKFFFKTQVHVQS